MVFTATGSVGEDGGDEVDSVSGFMTRTLMVLKGKTSPETRLSTADLQVKKTKQTSSTSRLKTATSVEKPSLSPDCDRMSFTQHRKQVTAFKLAVAAQRHPVLLGPALSAYMHKRV